MRVSPDSQEIQKTIEVDGRLYVHFATILRDILDEENRMNKQVKFGLDLRNVERIGYVSGLRAARQLLEDLRTEKFKQRRLL